MTTTTTSAERLTRLPAPVLKAVTEVVDLVIGMSAEEKSNTSQLLTGVGLTWANYGADETLPAAELVSALTRVVLAANFQAEHAAIAGGF